MYRIVWFETLVTLVNIHILLTRLMPGQIRKKTAVILFTLIILPCILAAHLYSNMPIGEIAALVCEVFSVIMPLFTVKNISKGKTIYVTLFYIGLSATLVNSIQWVAKNLQGNETVLIIISIVINSLLCIFCIVLGSRKSLSYFFGRITLIPQYLKVFLLLSIWLSALLACLLYYLFSFYPSSSGIILIQCLAAGLIILVGIMCPVMIANSMSGTYYKNMVSDADKQMRIQAKYYEQIAKVNTDMRDFRHDFKHLKIGLSGMLATGDISEARKSLEEFGQIVDGGDILFETGNPIADALLSEKHSLALGINAQIQFEGVIPNFGISPTDICVILGNGVDNALEACAKLSAEAGKTINITADFNNGFLFLKILNPTAHDVLIVNNTVASTKSDKEAHGIGLNSIRNVVQKYSGTMDLSYENNVFISEISLDLNEYLSDPEY